MLECDVVVDYFDYFDYFVSECVEFLYVLVL